MELMSNNLWGRPFVALALVLCAVQGLGCDDDLAAEGETCGSSDNCQDGLSCIEGFCSADANTGDPMVGHSGTLGSSDDATCTTSWGDEASTTGTTGGPTSGATAGDTTGGGSTGGGEKQDCTGVPAQYHFENPYDASMPTVVAEGMRLYSGSCGACHGPQASGTALAGSLADTIAAARSDCSYLWVISEGVPGTSMPAFTGQIGQDQIWQILTYLRSLQP